MISKPRWKMGAAIIKPNAVLLALPKLITQHIIN
jgi:hypothetical protein